MLAPTVPLSRHIFKAPTRFYKTGVVFMAWLNGHQEHFVMVGGQQSARNVLHFSELFRLADAAGLLADPPLACARMKQLLAMQRMQLRKLGDGFGAEADEISADFRAGLGCVFRFSGSGVPGPEVHPVWIPGVCQAASASPSRTSSTSSTIPSTPTS